MVGGRIILMNRKGFTLIELLIVVAIIGILAAVGAAVIPGLLENTKEKGIQSQHKQIVKYVQAEFLKCSLGYEYIFSTTSGVTSKCSSLSSGSASTIASTDPGTDVGTALKGSIKNIFESSKLAFMLVNASGNEQPCSAGDAGCHYVDWDKPRKIMKIYTYKDNSGLALITEINFNF